MENSYLQNEINRYNVFDQNSFVNAIREIAQICILTGLSKTDFFSKAAFYGGTCLRIFHNIDRFSEDLDFNVISDKEIDFNNYVNQAARFLGSIGFNCDVSIKEKITETSVLSCFINIDLNTMKNKLILPLFPSFSNGQQVRIKIEIETAFVKGATFEIKKLLLPNYSLINCFDYSSLFAGKINALLNRNWRNRSKGRDYYDFYYYVANHVPFNFNYVKEMEKKKGVTINNENDVICELRKKFECQNFDDIRKDVISFVSPDKDISFLNKEIFIDILKDIKSI